MPHALRPTLLAACVFLTLLSACSTPTQVPTEVSTSLPVPTASLTIAPSPTETLPPTATFTPTVTPTPRLPVAQGTVFPRPVEPITSANLEQLVPLASWGQGFLEGAVLSPDRTLLAFRSNAGAVLYDANTLHEIRRIATGFQVTSLAFSPDGKLLAAGLAQGKVQLYTISDGVLQSEFFKTRRAVNRLAFGPDRLIAFLYDDGKGLDNPAQLVIWQLSTGAEILAAESQVDWRLFSYSVISPDGQWVTFRDATGSRVLSTLDGKPAWEIPSGAPQSFSPDSHLLAVSNENQVNLFQAADGKMVGAVNGLSPQFTPDSRQLLTFDGDPKSWGKASLFDLPQENKIVQFIRSFDGFPFPTTFCNNCGIYRAHAAVSPDGKMLALVSRYFQDYDQKNSIKIYNLQDGSLIREIQLLSGKDGYLSIEEFSDGRKEAIYPSIQDILFADSGTLLSMETSLSGDALVKLRRWNLTSGLATNEVDLPDTAFEVTSLAFSPDGRELLTAYKAPTENRIEFREIDSGKIARQVSETVLFPAILQGLGYTPDKSALLIRDYRGHAFVSTQSGLRLSPNTIRAYHWPCDPETFSLDGSLVACNVGAYPAIGSLSTGKVLKMPAIHFYEPQSDWKFSPDGKLLAISRLQKEVDLIDTSTGQLLHHLPPGETMAFTPDSKYIAVVVPWFGYYFYDTQTGKLAYTHYTFDEPFQSIAFSPDGTLMATGGDGVITLWGMKPE